MITSFKHLPALVLFAAMALRLHAQGTAFTYQGRLADGAMPANGNYDLAFALYDSPQPSGNLLAGPVTNRAVVATNGVFATLVDFGSAFNGGSNWLEIAVCSNGANAFVTLSPRQQLTPVPYALCAAGLSGTLPAASISGALAMTQLPSGLVTNHATGITLAGAFSGSLSGASNYSAAALTGTLSAAQLPGVVITNNAPTFAEHLCLWFNAQQAANFNPALADGQPVAMLDYSASNQTVNLLAGSAQWSGHALNGRPAFLLNNTALCLTNFFLNFGQNLTITATFNSRLGTGSYSYLWSILGVLGRVEGLDPWIDNGTTTNYAFTGGECLYTQNTIDGGVQQRQFMTHVAVFCYQGSSANAWATLDGKPVFDSRIQPTATQPYLMDGALNLYVGCDVGVNNFFNGFLSDFRIYNTNLPDSYLQSLNTYLCQQAGLPQNCIHFVGDSISQGLRTSAPLADFAGFTAANFPNFLINTEAVSGRKSQEEMTNAFQWMPTITPGLNFVHVLIGANDFDGLSPAAATNQVPATLSNILAILTCAQSNGIPAIVGTLPSVEWETNGTWRTLLNDGIRSFTNLALIADYANTPLGTNGAFGNPAYFADRIHPNADGYTNLYAVLLPALQNLILQTGSSNHYAGNFAGSFDGDGGGLTNLDASLLNGQSAAFYQDAANLTSGLLPLACLPEAVVTNGAVGVTLAGAFGGDGGGLTNVNANLLNGQPAAFYQNAANLMAGTLPDTCLDTNVARLDAAGQIFAGPTTFNGPVGIGTNSPGQQLTVNGNIYATGTITPNSDRNLKTNFAPVDVQAVLAGVASLPIQQWRFRTEPDAVRHLGPMAQDFRATFGLGEIPTAIATVDADGVALAAIQALNQELEEQKARLRARDAEIKSLQASVAELRQAIGRLASNAR